MTRYKKSLRPASQVGERRLILACRFITVMFFLALAFALGPVLVFMVK